jgi:hypothetical protein
MVDGVVTPPNSATAPPIRRRSLRYVAYLVLLVINVINLLSYANFWPSAPTTAHDDALRYLAMSQNTFAGVDNPFALRFLSPFIVHQLTKTGLGLNDAWILLTSVATTATLIVFFKIVYDHFRLSLFLSMTVSLMLACTHWYVLYNLEDHWLVDPVNNLAIAAAVYTALRARPVWFTVVVLIGSVNKETVMMFAPLHVLLTWARGERLRDKAFLIGIVALGITAVAYLGFRIWMQSHLPTTVNYSPLVGGGVGNTATDNFRSSIGVGKKEHQFAIMETFHFLWFPFLYGLYRATRQQALRNPLLVAGGYTFFICLVGRLFASDIQRIMVMMAPVVLMIAALSLTHLDTARHRPWLLLLGFTYVAINLHWVPTNVAVALDILALIVLMVPTMLNRPTTTHSTISTQEQW